MEEVGEVIEALNSEAEQPVAEEQPAVETAPAQEQVDLSAQFAELTRRDKALRAQEHKLKSSLGDSRQEWINEFKANPLEKMKEFGISMDSLASAIMGDTSNVAPEPQAAPAIDPQLVKEIEELKQYKQDQVLNDFRKTVFDVVEKLPEDYELILNSNNGRDLYWNAVVDYHQTYGEAPDYSAIASGVENALLDEGKRLMALKKFQPKTEDKAPAPATETTEEIASNKTLSNKITPSAIANRIKVTPVGQTARSSQSDYSRFMEDSKRKVMEKFNIK